MAAAAGASNTRPHLQLDRGTAEIPPGHSAAFADSYEAATTTTEMSPSTLKELCRRANPFDTVGIGAAIAVEDRVGGAEPNIGADHGDSTGLSTILKRPMPTKISSSAVPFEAQIYVKGTLSQTYWSHMSLRQSSSISVHSDRYLSGLWKEGSCLDSDLPCTRSYITHYRGRRIIRCEPP